MPELPDVEVFRRYFSKTSLNKKITGVEFGDGKMLEDVSKQNLSRALKNKKFTDTKRHGKYLFAKAGNNWLVLHFGMTGFLKYYKNQDEKPDHVKLLVNFSNNYALAYDCMRKLGSIGLADNIDDFIKKKDLGKDPLSKDFRFEEFSELIRSNKGSLKSFFMNQKYIAGLGNVYVDELLFHAKLHPKSNIGNVDQQASKRLFRNINKIIEKALDVNAERAKFPRTYLINKRKDGENCPRCDGKIKQIKISGRSTYFCSMHQEKI